MNWVRQGRLELPTQEAETQMFEEAIIAMAQSGHHQYEISNFAKKGKESMHNLVYWDNEHYFGFGAGASGYLDQKRYKNYGPIQHYMKPLKEQRLPIFETEEISRANQIEEEMFLGLRKIEGVSLRRFEEKFNKKLTTVYQHVIAELQQQQLAVLEEDYFRLTPKGLFIGNDVFEKFLLDKEE